MSEDHTLPPSRTGDGLDPLGAAERALEPADLDLVLERAAALVAAESGAAAAAVLALDGESVPAAGWWPSRDGLPAATRAAVRRAARPAEAGGAGTAPGPAGPGTPDAPRVVPIRHAGATVGAVCLIADVRRPLDPETPGQRALRLALGPRLAHHLERRRAQEHRAQYERWFRLLDEQVHAFERDRQKWAAVAQHAEDGMLVTDEQGTIAWVNPAMAARRPASPAAGGWVGLACRDLCGHLGEPSACDECPVRRAIRDGETSERVLRRLDDAGTREHLLLAVPIRRPEGGTREVLLVVRDQSDLHQLRRTESRYRLLFERSPKGIVMVDPASRRILLANPMACHLTGRGPDELTHLQIEDLHPRGEWRRLQSRYAAGFAGRALPAFECRIADRAGGERLAMASGTHVELDGQDAVMLEFHDVTETRRVEEALRHAEERLRAVVANAPVVLFALDERGAFTLSEGRGLASLGLRPGEVVGRTVWEVYAGSPEILANVRRALGGETLAAVADLGALAFETRYAPLRDPAGRVTGVIGVAVDVTERRRLEAELLQSQKMEALGRLAAGVAHDFNNLLSAMLGHAEILAARLEASHPLRDNVREIQRAGGRGALLTRQLLDFGRKEPVAPRVFDANVVVAEIEDLLARLVGEDVLLTVTPAPAPAHVLMDPGQLEQVLMNLAVNARDAMPAGGRLAIAIGLGDAAAGAEPANEPGAPGTGTAVVLTVADEGCGMDEETLRHVFEPFYTTKSEGTGLGLSTVRAIVERAGGGVQVTSVPGGGATFRVVLPRAEAPAAAAAELPAPAGATPVPRGSETVLLAEDEDAVRGLAREVLAAHGYAVIEARDGVEALRRLHDHDGPLHLLISDVVMPRMSGGALAERVAVLHPEARLLLMSGHADGVSESGGALPEVVPFLRKPFTVDALLRTVRLTLDAGTDDRAA